MSAGRVPAAVIAGLLLSVVLAGSYLGRAQSSPNMAGMVAMQPPNRPVVALVFEGGPSTQTASIAALLHRLYVPATFIYAAQPASAYPDTIKQLVGYGDEVTLSSYTYVDLQSLSTPAVVAQLTAGEQLMRQLTHTPDRWFSPPFGDVDSRIIGIASSLGLETVVPSLNSYDLTGAGARAMAGQILNQTSSGSMVLFHDTGSSTSTSMAVLARIIPKLKYRGFRFATIDQLFGNHPLAPCAPNPSGQFAAKGVKPSIGTMIYGAWLSRLCRGIRLGPATSRERTTAQGTRQDFATTGHQIVYNANLGTTSVHEMWSWGAAIFAAKRVKPKFGTAITQSWFDHYFSGVDEGSALSAVGQYRGLQYQHFVQAWAVKHPGKPVVWTTHFSPPNPLPTPTPVPTSTRTRKPTPTPTRSGHRTPTPTATPTHKAKPQPSKTAAFP
jgi:peptidoglycan/xylan/chitin deacetylase (PgdA/CDA1 family)